MGIVADIKKFAIHDGPGIRTTVFLKGCPLTCWWCHNPENRLPRPEAVYREARCIRCGRCARACKHDALSMNDDRPVSHTDLCVACGTCAQACPAEARQIVGREMTIEEVMVEIRSDVIFYDESGGGATFSGGEPLLQPDFLRDLLNACRREGVHTTLDTTGYAPPDTFRDIATDVSFFLYDLKLMDDSRHQDCCGVSNQVILENLQGLAHENRRTIIRIPLIPGINDDDANLSQVADFVASLPVPFPVDILPYQQMGIGKYDLLHRHYRLRETTPPTNGRVNAAADIIAARNLRVTIKGQAR